MELLLAPGPDLPLPGGAGAAPRPPGGGHHLPLGLVQGVRVKLRPRQAGKVKPTFYSHVRFQFRIKNVDYEKKRVSTERCCYQKVL